jgi:hypothetical protein
MDKRGAETNGENVGAAGEKEKRGRRADEGETA